MKWQVALHGNADDLEDLSEIFCSPDLRIVREEDRYLLESTSFDECPDTTSVKNKTEKFLFSLNAAKLLSHFSSEPISRGAIQIVDTQGNRTIFVEDTIYVKSSARARLTVTEEDGTIAEIPPDTTITKWIPLIDTDERVKRVFDLMNHDFNSYISLYKIIEVVQEDSYAPVMRSGEFYNEIDRFKRTAESYDAIGKNARHAHSRFTRPEILIDLPTAKDLVTRIVIMWLNSKV